jgi:radical SAM superfamily enzyme YgiQ (UPF0313 family)
MNNIYLIQVVDSYGPNKFLPLAIGYQWLAAHAHQDIKDSWNLADVLIEKKNISTYVSSMIEPKVVAMSCYVWNWNYNQRLAQEIKKKFPNCVTVIGGPQVDYKNKNFFNDYPYFDVISAGENEENFANILRATVDNNYKIPNVISRFDDFKLLSPPRTKVLDDLPSPILTGFYDFIMDKFYEEHKYHPMWQVTYETMRGCPYHCSYCDIGDSYWNKITQFNIDRIYKEITWMGEKKIEYVSVCDSNWGILKRDSEITEFVIETKKKYGYPRFWDVTWAKNNSERIQDIALLDKKENTKLFKGITFAMQSRNSTTLTAIERFNLDEEVVQNSMDVFRENDIPTYSEIIWPLPNETVESLTRGLQELIDIGQRDFLMVHPLVLTPNSPMGQQSYIDKHGLQYNRIPLDTFWLKVEDPETYVVEEVDAVYATNTSTFEDTIEGHMIAHWLIVFYYYGWARVLMDYCQNTGIASVTDFVKKVIVWMKNHPNTLLGQEHHTTKNCITSVFEKETFWGRQVTEESVKWEYKSAASIILSQNRNKLFEELSTIALDTFGIDNKELLEINSHLCVDYNKRYPIHMDTSYELVNVLFGKTANHIIFDYADDELTNETEFYHKAYHYQRKNRYWRASTSFTINIVI